MAISLNVTLEIPKFLMYPLGRPVSLHRLCNLTFEEFCQLALPSTNQSLRDVALMRSKASHYASHRQLSFEAESILSDLIENELRLVKKREFLKAELLKKKDFIKQKALFM